MQKAKTARRAAASVASAYALLWVLANGGILGASLAARAAGGARGRSQSVSLDLS